MNNETLTNVFWGLFFIWFGVVTASLGGNVGGTVNSSIFALGTGVLLLLMNLARSLMHLRLGVLTMGLGALLVVIFVPVAFFHFSFEFLPALIIIFGVALVIGAIRTGRYQI